MRCAGRGELIRRLLERSRGGQSVTTKVRIFDDVFYHIVMHSRSLRRSTEVYIVFIFLSVYNCVYIDQKNTLISRTLGPSDEIVHITRYNWKLCGKQVRFSRSVHLRCCSNYWRVDLTALHLFSHSFIYFISFRCVSL
jgi:hypothetical protein